jgi:hypothetical protein
MSSLVAAPPGRVLVVSKLKADRSYHRPQTEALIHGVERGELHL